MVSLAKPDDDSSSSLEQDKSETNVSGTQDPVRIVLTLPRPLAPLSIVLS